MRPAWFMLHWLIGMAAIILGWFNIFKGLDEYVGSWPSGGERKVRLAFVVANDVIHFLFLDTAVKKFIKIRSCVDAK